MATWGFVSSTRLTACSESFIARLIACKWSLKGSSTTQALQALVVWRFERGLCCLLLLHMANCIIRLDNEKILGHHSCDMRYIRCYIILANLCLRTVNHYHWDKSILKEPINTHKHNFAFISQTNLHMAPLGSSLGSNPSIS